VGYQLLQQLQQLQQHKPWVLRPTLVLM
jgi:hypothetical protein